MHPEVERHRGHVTPLAALARRYRSRTWNALLAVWVLLVAAVAWWSLSTPRPAAPGAPGLLLLVLLATSAVVPALPAASPALVPDLLAPRRALVPVVPAEVLATWLPSLVLVAVAAPAVLAVAAADGTSMGLASLGQVVVAGLLLGTSAVTTACRLRRRRGPATALAYAGIAALWLGPLVLAPLLQLLLHLPVRLPVRLPDGSGTCVTSVQERSLPRTEGAAWLLAASTPAVLADAVARPVAGGVHGTDRTLVDLRSRVREDRLGPPEVLDLCWPRDATGAQLDADRRQRPLELPPSWPFALVAHLALGGAAVLVGVRRRRHDVGTVVPATLAPGSDPYAT